MPSPQAQIEYEALRATIRQRGTARVLVFWLAMAGWAAIVLLLASSSDALATIVTLVTLAAAFEAIYALHVGVERLGRYIQVFHEEPADGPAWEHTVMSYGREPASDDLDPLFSTAFALVNVLNFAPALVTGQNEFIVVALVAHVLFALRILRARRYVTRQRMTDLERFRRLREELGSRQAAVGGDDPSTA